MRHGTQERPRTLHTILGGCNEQQVELILSSQNPVESASHLDRPLEELCKDALN